MKLDNLTDDDLVAQSREGSYEAFETLVKRYEERIYRVIYRFVWDEEVAKDLAQETFVKIFNAIKRFEGRSAFYTWLYRVAVNTALDHKATAKYEAEKKKVTLDDGFVPIASKGPSPEQALMNKELASAINEAINSLGEELKTAIILREFEGLSYNEIAEVEGCPVGTVRSRLFRAREELMKILRRSEVL